jgi:hypothetical protein
MKRRRIERVNVRPSRREYREEFLRSDEWKKTRKRILKRDKGLCKRCGKPAKDVHHRNYRFDLPNQDKTLILLCRACHSLVHRAINVGALPSQHSEEMVCKLSEKRVAGISKKQYVPPGLIKEILDGTNHGVKMACGILKISEGTLRSIPIGIKTSKKNLDHLKWIAAKRPTYRQCPDRWKELS